MNLLTWEQKAENFIKQEVITNEDYNTRKSTQDTQ